MSVIDDIKNMVGDFQKGLQPRIGTTLMKPIRAQIGRPTDNAVWVTGGNLPDNKEIYIKIVTDDDPLSYSTCLLGSLKKTDVYLDRPILVTKNDAGFYRCIGFDDAEDAIYSDGIDELDDQTPVYNKQLIEQCTIHPINGVLQARVTSGMLGTVYFSGVDTGLFSTGTVQDTSAANITEPATNGNAKGILVQIDTDTETLEYKQSSEFDSILTLQQAYRASLLPAADTGKVLRGYIKWVKGATQFTYADIWNVITIGGGADLPVDDTTSLVQDPADNTKQVRIDAGNVTTGTVRVLTMPDADVTLPANPIGGSTGATDNALLRADGTGGSTVQGSTATCTDTGYLQVARFQAVGTSNDNLFVVQRPSSFTADTFRIQNSSGLPMLRMDFAGGFYVNTQQTGAGIFRVDGNSLTGLFSTDPSQNSVGINAPSPHASAIFEIASTDKGFLPPRMTSAQWAAISSKPDGLMAYDTDLDEYVGMKNGASAVIGSAPRRAVLTYEVASGTNGGSSSATTWNARSLNTEQSDPDGIASISSNKFTPIALSYKIRVRAEGGGGIDGHRIRLYNVTAGSTVEIGDSMYSEAVGYPAPAFLTCEFTANGTDEYRIDHYTTTAVTNTGLGRPVSSGDAEVYLVIELEELL